MKLDPYTEMVLTAAASLLAVVLLRWLWRTLRMLVVVFVAGVSLGAALAAAAFFRMGPQFFQFIRAITGG